ncbi:MAG: TonB-dependent receptor plug domain-containing protein [Kordiimonas sp.]
MTAKFSVKHVVKIYSKFIKHLMIFSVLFTSALANSHDRAYHFDIPAMPLSEALLQFSKVTDIAILAPATLLSSKHSKDLRGSHSAKGAIKSLLQGNNIGFEFRDETTIILKKTMVSPTKFESEYQRIFFNSVAYYEQNLGYYDASLDSRDALSTNIDEIFITGNNRDHNKTKMSVSAQLLLDTPGTLNDPLWGFLTSPSVTFGSGAYNGEVIIRGSSPDDHLFLIDGMRAGYLFHDFGDGILSKNTIHRFQLNSSAFGAEYGGAIGSVIDVSLRNPDTSRFRGAVDLNMIKAGVHLETPVGDRGGFYMDARVHTLHLFVSSFDDEKDLEPQLDLVPTNFDYTSRYRYEKDGLALTATVIGAQDVDAFEPNSLVSTNAFYKDETKSAFHTQAIAVEKSWDNGATFDTTMSHTRHTRNRRYGDNRFEDYSRDDYYIRSKFETGYHNHILSAGVNFAREKGVFDYDTRLIFCDDFSGDCPSSDFEQRRRSDTFNDLELYIQDYIALSDRVSLEIGFQFSRDFFLKESFFEPRAGVFWQASDTLRLYARAGRHHQRQDVSRSLALRYTARAQLNDRSSHFLIGTQLQLAQDLYLATEAYYKHQDAALYPTSSQERFVSGRIYGFEFTLSKPPRDEGVSGSVSVGYANSKRQDDSTGQQINYRYSRPFNAVFGVKYAFGNGWSLGGRYQMQSGLLYTPLNGVSLHEDGYFLYDFGELYSQRTDGYNRLDLRLEKHTKHSFGEVVYHLDVINALSQKSPEDPSYGFPKPDGNGGYTALIHTDDGFPLIVSIGIGLTF